jgi:hypothetical protein
MGGYKWTTCLECDGTGCDLGDCDGYCEYRDMGEWCPHSCPECGGRRGEILPPPNESSMNGIHSWHHSWCDSLGYSRAATALGAA